MGQIVTNSGEKGRRSRRSIHLDMTPMVDLAFLLLTFFVLTVTLQEAFVLKMNMPDQETRNQPEVKIDRVLTIILGERNRVYYYQGKSPQVNVTDFSARGIRQLLMVKNREIPELVVFVKPSKQSRYKNLIDILDEIEIAKVPYYYIVKETVDDVERVAAVQR